MEWSVAGAVGGGVPQRRVTTALFRSTEAVLLAAVARSSPPTSSFLRQDKYSLLHYWRGAVGHVAVDLRPVGPKGMLHWKAFREAERNTTSRQRNSFRWNGADVAERSGCSGTERNIATSPTTEQERQFVYFASYRGLRNLPPWRGTCQAFCVLCLQYA